MPLAADYTLFIYKRGSRQGRTGFCKKEKSFKNTITTNNLKESILYLDLTNENIPNATNKLKIDDQFPYLVVYTNGKITDTYKINKNNYNTKKIEKYLTRIGVIEND